MPSSPYAQLRVKVNGGAPQTGDVIIAAGDTIQFDATSYDGWAAPVARWEIYSFPTGWGGPGGAWSSESVPQTDGTTYTVWYWLGNSEPPSFVAPASTLWGKFLTRLLVNGGSKGGNPSTDVEDKATMLDMLSPTVALKDLAWRESTQSGGAEKWVKDHKANLRLIDDEFAFILANLSAPSEASFVAGKQSTSSATNVTIASRTFNPAVYNSTGRVITWRAWMRVTSGATATLELYNLTTAATVHTFTSTSSVGEAKSQVFTVPTDLPNSLNSYELRLKRTGGIGTDVAECFSALLEISY